MHHLASLARTFPYESTVFLLYLPAASSYVFQPPNSGQYHSQLLYKRGSQPFPDFGTHSPFIDSRAARS
jgi:hypothetical protein